MFPIQARFRRWRASSLAMAALAGPPVHALSRASPRPAKDGMPTLFSPAQRVAIGRITHKGATINEQWRRRSPVITELENPVIPCEVPQEYCYQPDKDEYVPGGLYRVEIAQPKVSHRKDADGKLHWTLQKPQRWPLAAAQRVSIAPGAKRLSVKLPARLRPIRVQVHMPACVGRCMSVYPSGAVLRQQESWPMGSFEPDRCVRPGGVCLPRLAALPRQAVRVDDSSPDGFGIPRRLGIDSVRATRCFMPLNAGDDEGLHVPEWQVCVSPGNRFLANCSGFSFPKK